MQLQAQNGSDWSSWQQVKCFKGLFYSVRTWGYSNNAKGYLWGIRFRNDYDKPITFSYKLSIGEDIKSDNGFDVTSRLKPGEIWTDGGDVFTAKLYQNASTNYWSKVIRVCFGDKPCNSNCFAGCDVVEGKPNQPDCEDDKDQSQINNADISGEYINDYDQITKIALADGGIMVEWQGSNTFYKQISDNVYMSDQIQQNGYELYLEFPGNNELKTWYKRNGVLSDEKYTYRRKSANNEIDIIIQSGEWISEGSKANISVTKEGLIYHIINSVDNGHNFIKELHQMSINGLIPMVYILVYSK